jgi:CheY-like chemotaxis protein
LTAAEFAKSVVIDILNATRTVHSIQSRAAAARKVAVLNRDLNLVYVEDDPPSRLVMQLIAKHMLHVKTLTIFENSVDILSRIRSLNRRPDIIFLDIQIKPHDGYEMVKMMRQDADLKEIKIIAVTASMIAATDKMRASGFDGMISKPINPLTFPLQVERIVHGEKIWDVEIEEWKR